MAFSVLLDTCTLFGGHLRDVFLRLAEAGTYRPLWSAEILDELEGALVRESATTQEQARRIIALMREHFADAEVVGHDDLILSMRNHPKDRHVLAAAARANASALVTFNLTDFPASAMASLGIEVLHPDTFLLNQYDLMPETVARVLREKVTDHTRPPLTLSGLLEALRRADVPRFADAIDER